MTASPENGGADGRRGDAPPAGSHVSADAPEAYTGAMQAQGQTYELTTRSRSVRPTPGLPQDFEGWFHEYRGTVYRYVRFRVATREVAEDVTSEVFMKALRSIHRYDPTIASPKTWLLRIARNAVTDHLRALKRRGSLHVSLDRVPDLVADVPSQEERVVRQERIQRLLNGTQTLRKADQEILSLRYGSGLDNAEIAEHLGISNNAVAVRLHRALKRLKVVVDGESRDSNRDHDE